jgi:hypothetical protein
MTLLAPSSTLESMGIVSSVIPGAFHTKGMRGVDGGKIKAYRAIASQPSGELRKVLTDLLALASVLLFKVLRSNVAMKLPSSRLDWLVGTTRCSDMS